MPRSHSAARKEACRDFVCGAQFTDGRDIDSDLATNRECVHRDILTFCTALRAERNAIGADRRLQGRERTIQISFGQVAYALLFNEVPCAGR